MGRYTSLLYQIVYSTKYRTPCMHKAMRPKLFKYITGILKKKKCFLYQINGVEDHLHIVLDIHPSQSISGLVKDIKLASSSLIKTECLIPNFPGWQIGYGAFSYSMEAKHNLINYVKNQEQHHQKRTFKKEFLTLLEEHEVDYDEQYVFE